MPSTEPSSSEVSEELWVKLWLLGFPQWKQETGFSPLFHLVSLAGVLPWTVWCNLCPLKAPQVLGDTARLGHGETAVGERSLPQPSLLGGDAW